MGQIPDVKGYFSQNRSKLEPWLTYDERTIPSTVNLSGGSNAYEPNKVYIVNGTVNIKQNITNTSPVVSNDSQLTQMVIIADNINIDHNVTQVDAWLITPGGIVDTCADSPVQLTISDCTGQLTVNGPVMAKSLHARRTAGEDGVSAEIFNLRSDVYVWARGVSNRSGTLRTVYTRELPPRY